MKRFYDKFEEITDKPQILGSYLSTPLEYSQGYLLIVWPGVDNVMLYICFVLAILLIISQY